jgi:hypothetical protein
MSSSSPDVVGARESSSRRRAAAVARVLGGGAVLWVLAWATPAQANGVAVGLFAGDPVALTLRVGVADRFALEGAVGWSPGPSRSGVVSLGLTYALRAEPWSLWGGGLVPTVGLGGRWSLSRLTTSTATLEIRAGARAPAALAWRLDGLEVYLEAAPGVELRDDVRMTIEGGVGVRIEL